jgi:hypothetical protein
MFFDVITASNADILIFELEFMQSRTRCVHPPLWALWPPVMFWIPHPATLVRSKLFELYGQFDNNYSIAMDGEIWFRFLSKNSVVDLLSFPVSLYDEHGVSRLQFKKTAQEGKQIIINNLPMLIKSWIQNGLLLIQAYWMFYKRGR